MRLVLPIAIVCASLLLGLAVRPDRLYVERVEFEGASRASEAELRHLASLQNGSTIWSVDLERVAAGVATHPWVRAASARRRFPNAVVVEVEEHAPEAVLAYQGGLFYVDERGTPFLRAHTNDLDHPVITGVDPALAERHPDLPALVVRDALWLLNELDARSLLVRAQVSEIAFHPTHGFRIRTTGGSPAQPATEVLFALGGYERQLGRLTALLDRGVDLAQSLHVDLGPARVAIVRPMLARAVEVAQPAPAVGVTSLSDASLEIPTPPDEAPPFLSP